MDRVSPASALAAASVFTWLGMVLAISFLEAPLKFRAPGITVPLGVGIGRLVFRALNLAEGVLAVVLLVCAVLHPALLPIAVALVVVLAAGALLLRPRMDRRVRAGETADGMPRHSLHLWYIGLEVLKVVLLLVAGVQALTA
jgi:uncharacterized paraquat-inducible protein A